MTLFEHSPSGGKYEYLADENDAYAVEVKHFKYGTIPLSDSLFTSPENSQISKWPKQMSLFTIPKPNNEHQGCQKVFYQTKTKIHKIFFKGLWF